MKITEKNKEFWPRLWVTKNDDGDEIYPLAWVNPDESDEGVWVAEYKLISVKRHVVSHEYRE